MIKIRKRLTDRDPQVTVHFERISPLASVKVHPFESVLNCPKCGNFLYRTSAGPHSKPTHLYLSFANILQRGCVYCSYTWYEQCRDGSLPIQGELVKEEE